MTVGVDHNPVMKLQAMIRRATVRQAPSLRETGCLRAPVGVAAVLWLAVAVVLTWWLLRLSAHEPWRPLPVMASPAALADPALVARALGHLDKAVPAAAQPVIGSRLRLLGVVSQPPGQGAALIAVDGQPARPYLVGSRIGDTWVLSAVERQGVRLSPADGNGAELALQVPPQPR